MKRRIKLNRITIVILFLAGLLGYSVVATTNQNSQAIIQIIESLLLDDDEPPPAPVEVVQQLVNQEFIPLLPLLQNEITGFLVPSITVVAANPGELTSYVRSTNGLEIRVSDSVEPTREELLHVLGQVIYEAVFSPLETTQRCILADPNFNQNQFFYTADQLDRQANQTLSCVSYQDWAKHFAELITDQPVLNSVAKALNNAILLYDPVPGAIAGDFEVNGNGGAMYTIPITVPPGRQGIQPDLSLQYNSQQGNGLVGIGWSLSGLSSIAICPKNATQDLKNDSNKYDGEDRYCFDGQRLVATDGEYGRDGTEYHTERESWMRITSHGQTEYAPEYFIVVSKDGTTFEYGRAGNSRVIPSNRSNARVWAVNRITDRNGNYLTISYGQDLFKDNYYPLEILYTGNANSGAAPHMKVMFELEERLDDIVRFSGEAKTQTLHRLASISTHVETVGAGWGLVKKYYLNYEYSPETKRSRLRTIKECGVTACLSPTAFKWTAGSVQSWQAAAVGLQPPTDIASQDTNTPKDRGIRFVDLNGDGLADILQGYQQQGNDTAQAWINQGDHWEVSPQYTPPVAFTVFEGSESFDFGSRLVDLNGDGLLDIVRHFNYGNSSQSGAWLNNGNGWQPASSYVPPVAIAEYYFEVPNAQKTNAIGIGVRAIGGSGTIGTILKTGDRGVRFADIDGDGLSDMIYSFCDIEFDNNGNPTSTDCFDGFWRNTGSGWVPDSDYEVPPSFEGTGYILTIATKRMINNKVTYSSDAMFFDVNGDGRQDLVSMVTGEVFFSDSEQISHSSGVPTGNWRPSLYRIPNQITTFPYGFQFIDLNGDGLLDLIQKGEHEGIIKSGAWINNPRSQNWSTVASQYTPPLTIATSVGDESMDRGMRLVDLNGDRLQDIVQYGTKAGSGTLKGAWLNDPTATGNKWVDAAADLIPPTAITDINSAGELVGNGTQFVDLNGDGLADLLQRVSGNSGAWINTSIPNPDLIASITDGIGGLTEIQYQPLTNETVYTKGSLAVYPNRDMQTPLFVVSRHTENTQTHDYEFEHRYEGAIQHAHRGWLGFSKTYLTDLNNETITETRYHLDFPLSGMIYQQETRNNSNGYILSRTLWEYQSQKVSGIIEPNRYRTWLASSTVQHYTEGTHNYDLITEYTYDNQHRNITMIAHRGDISIEDEGEDSNACTVGSHIERDNHYTCFQYHSSGDDWWMSSFPISEKQVTNRAGCNNFSNWNAATDLSWKQYEYTASGMNTRKQKEWNDTKNQFSVIETTHDAYGNEIAVINAGGITTSYEYDNYYHSFNERTTGPLGIATEAKYDPRFGLVVEETDNNGYITMQVAANGIDDFGRVVEILGLDGGGNLIPLERLEYQFGPNRLGLISRRSTRTSINNGDSWLFEETHIDEMERPIKTVSNGFDASTILVSDETVYNSKSEAAKTYLPFYRPVANESCVLQQQGGDCIDKETLASHNVYDRHGRLQLTTYPDGSTQEYVYQLHDDRKVVQRVNDPRSTSDADTVDWVEHYSSRGKVKRRIAPDGSVEYYHHDRQGRMVCSVDPSGGQSRYIYNSLGLLIEDIRPATGSTRYEYNNNEQLLSRLDSMNQKIAFEYDALGRTIRKEMYSNANNATLDETTLFEYDNPAKDNATGRVTKVTSNGVIYEFFYDQRGFTKERKVVLDIDRDGTFGNMNEETLIFQFSYDVMGRLETTTYPDGSVVKNSYRNSDGLHKVELKEPLDQEFVEYISYGTATALGAVTSMRHGNGMPTEFAYDVIGRLQRFTTLSTDSSSNLLDFQYDWSTANKLLGITDHTSRGLS